MEVALHDSIAPSSVTLNAPAAKSSAGTALVMAMLGATLSATVGFIAVGNAHPVKAAAVAARPAVVATAKPVAMAPQKAAEAATVIAGPMPSVPVGILTVEAPKNTKVYVDGTLFGTAPITVTAPMGLHTVKLEGTKKGDVRAWDVVFGSEPNDLKAAPEKSVVRTSQARSSAPQTPSTDKTDKTEKTDKGGMKAEIEKSKALQKDAASALGDSLGH